MKKEELKASFDRIKPDEAAKKRMLDNILNQYERKKGFFMPLNLKRAIPALAVIVVMAGGLLTYNHIMKDRHFTTPYEYNSTGTNDMIREDAVAPIVNQFRIDKRHYILLSEDLREDFGLPELVDSNDIGEKIAEIENSPDTSLVGCEVYRYVPAGGEAVVAVKRDNEYQLFRFFTFESYINNQDEDAAEYLKLYGINGAGDISKIRFITHSEQGKLQGYEDIAAEITDRDDIAAFYSYYSVLKNSSDRYFDSLFNFRGTNENSPGIVADPALPGAVEPDMTAPDRTGYGTELLPDTAPEQTEPAYDLPLIADDGSNVSSADTPVSSGVSSARTGMTDMGGTGAGYVPPSMGSAGDALANPVTIRIYNQNGIYYDSPYYRNIGFISRYEVNEEFREFIAGYLDD